MTGLEWGAVMLAALLVALALRIHIGIAMLMAGSIGYIYVSGLAPLLNYFKAAAYARFSVYDLSVVPLFLLMGQFATHGVFLNPCFGRATLSWAICAVVWRWGQSLPVRASALSAGRR